MNAFPLRDTEALMAALSTEAPRLAWDAFLPQFHPKPGEHIAVIGSTGRGKTVLQNNLLRLFPYTAVFATKPVDKTMTDLIERHGYLKLAQWRQLSIHEFPRRIVWPDASRLDSRAHQATVFKHAMERIFQEKGRPFTTPVGWCIGIDELWYICNRLKLEDLVEQFLYQSRSLGHSMLLATQAPFYVPQAVYTQSTHLFFFQNNEYRVLQRLGELQTSNKELVRMTVSTLEQHQVLYLNNVTGRMIRTRTPNPL